jgi:hypothetical protein
VKTNQNQRRRKSQAGKRQVGKNRVRRRQTLTLSEDSSLRSEIQPGKTHLYPSQAQDKIGSHLFIVSFSLNCAFDGYLVPLYDSQSRGQSIDIPDNKKTSFVEVFY